MNHQNPPTDESSKLGAIDVAHIKVPKPKDNKDVPRQAAKSIAASTIKVPLSTPSVSINTKPIEQVVLLSGAKVDKEFYDSIIVEIRGRLVRFTPGRPYTYTAKELCGPRFWIRLSDGECRMAGMCVVNMVERGELPLIPVKMKHEYPKYYQLK